MQPDLRTAPPARSAAAPRRSHHRRRSGRGGWRPGLAAALVVAVLVLFVAGPGPLPSLGGLVGHLRADPAPAGNDTVSVDALALELGRTTPAEPVPSTFLPTRPPTAPPSSAPSAPVATPSRAVPAPGAPRSSGNPFAGARFYIDPSSSAAAGVRDLQASAPANADLLNRLARGSAATWFGDADPGTLGSRVSAQAARVRAAGALPVLVAYGIPNRDCGNYSGGGAASPDAYRAWIAAFAAGVRGGAAAVILEPDGLSLTDCLSAGDKESRLELLRYAVGVLSSAGASVYIDAGNAGWHSPAEMAALLRDAGVDQARGFSLNVSNFDETTDEIAYGKEISAALGGGTHFVVDTSRNGQGPAPDGAWCNPPGRGLGVSPTANTGDARVDAYLWIKIPGESDGTCNGGPPAGQFWLDYALGLASRAA